MTEPQDPFAAPGPPPPPGYGPPPPGYVAPPPPPGYGYPAGWAPYPVVKVGTNGFAIASLVLGILWLYWVGSILALVFGYIALKQIKERLEGGRGMAIAGVVLGWIGVAMIPVVILVVFAFGTFVKGEFHDTCESFGPDPGTSTSFECGD